MIIHFALGGHAACGQHIHGNIANTSDPDDRFIGRWSQDYCGGPNIQHVCIPALVTCKACRKTKQFKDYTNDSEKRRY